MSALQVTDYFPGFGKMPAYIEGLIEKSAARSVVDIGGGANPVLSPELIEAGGLDYTVLDISRAELDKAPGSHRRLCVDVAAPAEQFAAAAGEVRADLVFSHMVFEHLKDPAQAHRNVRSILRPGGIAVHLFPSPNNLPLLANRILPEWFTTILAAIADPGRDIKGRQGKFPAYYKLCGIPSEKLRRTFEGLGYEVVEHTGYIGHSYYDRIPGLRQLELTMRKPLVKAGIPMISDVLLVLRAR